MCILPTEEAEISEPAKQVIMIPKSNDTIQKYH